MSSRIVHVILLLIAFSVAPAYADSIQGHIVRIDRERGEVEMILSGDGTEEGRHHLPEGQPPVHTDEASVVKVLAMWFPRCLSEGMMIFARGSYIDDDMTIFEAEEVFPLRRHGRKDKTGVRSRFRHHGGRGHHKGNHAE